MSTDDPPRLSTGAPGLDQILHGGLLPNRGYMLRGEPGAGKTILALQFLTAGDTEDGALFVNLEETEEDIRRNAASLGIDLDGVDFLDLTPTSDAFTERQSYSVFEPDEVEGQPLKQEIIDRVDDVDPTRVVIDPITQLRYLTPDSYQFRKEVTGLIRFFEEQEATVLFTSQAADHTPDDDLQFLSHGVVDLRHGDAGRAVRVPKFRGSDSRGGWHGFRIGDGGIRVYPKLVPEAHTREFESGTISSGIQAVDELLGGGLERGTVTILSGPSGVGKTSLGAQFMKEAAGRGERSVIYEFEESYQTIRSRSEAIKIPIRQMEERGTLRVEIVEPLEKSTDEFSDMVRTDVEEDDATLVMIDGTAGYRLALRGEDTDIVRELHSLCRYLKNMGVTVILVEEIATITGDFKATSRNISYIADNIVFLRYLELKGELRKAIGVLKKRMSDFERTLREFEITQRGIEVGEPLEDFVGILQGTPQHVAESIEDGD